VLLWILCCTCMLCLCRTTCLRQMRLICRRILPWLRRRKQSCDLKDGKMWAWLNLLITRSTDKLQSFKLIHLLRKLLGRLYKFCKSNKCSKNCKLVKLSTKLYRGYVSENLWRQKRKLRICNSMKYNAQMSAFNELLWTNIVWFDLEGLG